MSEYQFVAFQAVDSPLDDKQLRFAEDQSSRAELTRWSFCVEYQYGSFRGDADGLLRRGFDVHLNYTNYGTREIKLRLPHGMPFAKKVWQKYVDGERLVWEKDARGAGGILTVRPSHEPGELELIWEPQAYLPAVIWARERLTVGDLRALYLLWLCAADDYDNDPDEAIEPPVPHGVSELTDHGEQLLWFFGLDPLLLTAAGQSIPGAPHRESEQQSCEEWIQSLDGRRAKVLLTQMLTGKTATVKAKLLAEIRASKVNADWPTTDKKRSFTQLLELAETLHAEEEKKKQRKAQAKAQREAAKAQRRRDERKQQMVKDPDKWLREAQRRVEGRGKDNYNAAAEILHDLREAVGGDDGDAMTRRYAAQLIKKHPTLSYLKGALRKRGLL